MWKIKLKCSFLRSSKTEYFLHRFSNNVGITYEWREGLSQKVFFPFPSHIPISALLFSTHWKLLSDDRLLTFFFCCGLKLFKRDRYTYSPWFGCILHLNFPKDSSFAAERNHLQRHTQRKHCRAAAHMLISLHLHSFLHYANGSLNETTSSSPENL